jgi:hypothetical protein
LPIENANGADRLHLIFSGIIGNAKAEFEKRAAGACGQEFRVRAGVSDKRALIKYVHAFSPAFSGRLGINSMSAEP